MRTQTTNTLRHSLSLFAAAVMLAATGCAVSPTMGPAGDPPVSPVTGKSIRGSIHGGQQPVDKATIQLYAASKTGYGNTSTALISSTVQSDAGGGFTITGAYSCQPSDLLYIVATGGNPGVSGTHNNSGLAMMTGLGRCDSLTSSTFIQMNELTTVASVWALAPFMTDITHVGSSPTNVQGLANAFAVINELVDVASGNVSGPTLPAGATLPISEIDTLADILAVCVNTVDSAVPALSSQCSTIFNAATPAATAPTNTIMAALNLAQNPALGLALSDMANPTAPFQPILPAPPTSWTVAINYVGGGLSAPAGIATDANGDIWLANKNNNSVSKFDFSGKAVSGPSGFTAGLMNAPVAIAIDKTGNAWVANSGNDTVTQLDSTGASGTPFSGGGLSNPKGIAIDAAGNIWIANFGNSSITELSSAGTAISGSNGFVRGGLSQPNGIAINPK